MVKDVIIPVRTSAKDRAVLKALEDAGVGENVSDRTRLGWRALARQNKVKVPA